MIEIAIRCSKCWKLYVARMIGSNTFQVAYFATHLQVLEEQQYQHRGQ